MATLDHTSKDPDSKMHLLFKTCGDVTCSHPICLGLRGVDRKERDMGLPVADIARFEVIDDERKKQIRKLDFENKDLQKDIASLEKINKAHEQEKNEQTRTIDNLQTTVADLRKTLAKAGDEAKREKQRKENEQALAKAHKDGEANRKKCEALKKASVELEKDNSELRKSRDEAENKARESEVKIGELIIKTEKASAVAKKRLLEDGEEIKDLKSRLHEAEQQVKTGTTKIMNLVAKSFQAEQQAATHAATMKRLESQLSDAGKKATTDQKTIEQLNTHLIDASQQHSADEAKMKKLQAQILEYDEHLNTLRVALQDEKDRNEIFKQESEHHKQKTTNILVSVQGYLYDAMNNHKQDPAQFQDPFRGQGQPDQTTGHRIQSPDTGYESSLHTNTAATTPISYGESKAPPREHPTQSRPYSPESGETDRSRNAITPRSQQMVLPKPRREREKPPFTLAPLKTSPVASTSTQDLRHDPAFNYTPPRGPRRSSSQHPDGDKRGTRRRRQDSVSQRGYDSWRPGGP